MTTRYFEVDSILHDIDSIQHETYRGIDYTWANKFRLFYANKPEAPKIKDFPINRFGFVSRNPIARCVLEDRLNTAIGMLTVTKYYKLGLSKNWRKQVDKMFEFFQFNNINQVHVDEDISVYKNLFIQVANKFGVATFVHQHGALGQKHGFLPLTAKYMVVWDERNKLKLTSWGLEPDRIIVGGYDERYKPIKESLKPWVREAVRKEFGLDDRPIILFSPYTFSNFGDGSEKEIHHGITMIQEAIRRLSFDRHNIIVKLHPSSKDLSYWEWWAEYSDVSCTIIKDYNPYELIYASEAVVVQSSTLAIDGLRLGKKVITIDSGFTTAVEEYCGEENLVVAKTVEEIIGAL